MWPVLDFFAYSFEAAADGIRPHARWDGSPWPGESQLGALALSSPRLQARYIVSQVKGDWSEYASTFGFPTWSAHNVPCLYCKSSLPTMHMYDEVNVDGHGWGDLPPGWYDRACKDCEIEVNVASERIRTLILVDGGLHFDTRKLAIGQIVKRGVAALGLNANDRLEPGPGLRDVGLFETQQLPFTVTFWRVHRDARKRLSDKVHHRNPLFSARVGIDPSVLMVDVLHCVYLGVYQKFVSEVLWAAVDVNLYGINGSADFKKELTVKRLFSDMCKYWDTTVMPRSERVGRFTPAMLGSTNHRELKTKVVETARMVGWALDFVRRHPAQIPNGPCLRSAGDCLVEWQGIVSNAPQHMSAADSDMLLFLCIRHNVLMLDYGCSLLPKHHQWVHMCLRIPACENPKFYSCFFDESLNSVLASLCQASHKLRWEFGVFDRIRLLPFVQKQSYWSKL